MICNLSNSFLAANRPQECMSRRSKQAELSLLFPQLNNRFLSVWWCWSEQHEFSRKSVLLNRADSLKTASIQNQSVWRSLINLKLVRLGYMKACADTESSCHVKARSGPQEEYKTKVSNLSHSRKPLCPRFPPDNFVYENISTEYTIYIFLFV